VGKHADKSTEEKLRMVLAVLRGEVSPAEAGRRAGVSDMTAALPGLSGQNTWTFTYNDVGKLIQLESPLSSNAAYATATTALRQWTYNSTGMVQAYTVGRGSDAKTTTYTYELAGWLKTAVDPRSTIATLKFFYDNYGNLVERYSQVKSTRRIEGLVKTLGIGRIEPRRESWRLQPLRGWSHDQERQVPAGGPRASGEDGVGASGGTPLAVGRDHLHRKQVRHVLRDAPPLGPPGRGRRGLKARADQHGARADESA
jgi:hypothetical protein